MRKLLSTAALALALTGPAYAFNEPTAGDVRLQGAKCDAQVVYDFFLVTAGSGGTRQVTFGGTPSLLPSVGQPISIGIGGASATSAWHGTVASVSGRGGVSPVVTVTAAAGTAVAAPTASVAQWGTDDTTKIISAITKYQGVAPIVIPGKCAISGTLSLTVNGAEMVGLLAPVGHHDAAVPYYPGLSSALVWLGGASPMLLQTSVEGATNLGVRGQHIANLSFYAGNGASIGRDIATVSNSTAENLYVADAASYSYVYGLNGAHNLAEVAATCYLKESNFVSDAQLTPAVGYFLTGDTTSTAGGVLSPWNTCASQFDNFTANFSAGDGIQIILADHNIFTNFIGNANGGATTGYFIHLSGLDTTFYSQSNGFKKISVGNIGASPATARIKVEPVASGNWIEQLDMYSPPAGWGVSNGSLNPFSCTSDQGTSCIPNTYALLQTCDALNALKVIPIIDSNTAVFNATITGSGANIVNAFCDGTNWKVH